MSYRNFSQKSRVIKDALYMDYDNQYSYDPVNVEEINIEAWREFFSYYRYYIDEFAENCLQIKLYPFQRVILRAMAKYKESMFIASRGLGKSWLSAVFMVCYAILYPGVKIGIVSGKGQQSRNVILQKIKGELYKNENVAREIINIKTGQDDCVVEFKNGSEIRAIVLGQRGENARSWRFNVILADESRLIPASTLEEIVIPMTKTKRQNVINLTMKYGNEVPIEKGRIIYISSAYLKICDLYQRFLHHYNHMLTDDKNEFYVCTLPYQVGVNAGIFYEDDILKEKEKPSMSQAQFDYEYGAIFVGSSNESFFPYELTDPCRTLEKCELQQSKKSLASYIIAHDVAIADNVQSDNACTTVIKLKPKSNGIYIKEVVLIKIHRGATLPEQRDYIRELLIQFPNTQKLIIDVRGNGQPLPSLFDEIWEYKNEKGEVVEYPPLVPDDDDERMRLKDAIPLIRAINATQPYNHQMYNYMKQCFENKTLKLLVSSTELDMAYKNGEITEDEFMCYINTDLLIQELSNIKQVMSSFSNVVYDRISKTVKRDRATSLGYGLNYIREIEEENKLNIMPDDGANILDYLLIN